MFGNPESPKIGNFNLQKNKILLFWTSLKISSREDDAVTLIRGANHLSWLGFTSVG